MKTLTIAVFAVMVWTLPVSRAAHADPCTGTDAELLDAYEEAWSGPLAAIEKVDIRTFTATFVARDYRMTQAVCTAGACVGKRAVSRNAVPIRTDNGRKLVRRYIRDTMEQLAGKFPAGVTVEAAWVPGMSDCRVGGDAEAWNVRWTLTVRDGGGGALYTLVANSEMAVEGADNTDDRTLLAEHVTVASETY